MHYSITRVLHPRQGLEELKDMIRGTELNLENTRLVYFLAGRAEVHLSPAEFAKSLEQVLRELQRRSPRIMILLGAIPMFPTDSPQVRANILELNLRMARLADRDPHWLFCNINNVLTMGGQPQKKFFDSEGKVSKAGCRLVAQNVVAASRSARMQRNFDVLDPWSEA